MIYVVLGMHKSGTTLVSEMLHHSGIDMLEADGAAGGYDEGNTWERESTKAVNHGILGSAGAHSLRTTRRGYRPPDPECLGRMREVVAELSARHGDWGFKDPRTCLTYDLWAGELPEHRLVVVYRRPEECFAHYRSAARGNVSRSLDVLVRCLPAWCEHNAAIIAAVERAAAPAIVVHYSRLMDGDAEFRRLERFVGRPLADRRLDMMHRSRVVPGADYRIAALLHALAGGASPERLASRLDSLRD
ncbi:MAG: sulfotransferase [Planctomycetota bacterium]